MTISPVVPKPKPLHMARMCRTLAGFKARGDLGDSHVSVPEKRAPGLNIAEHADSIKCQAAVFADGF